jgi:hypothetical protein
LVGEVLPLAQGGKLFDEFHSQADQLTDLPEADDAGEIVGPSRPTASVRAAGAKEFHFDQELVAQRRSGVHGGNDEGASDRRV